MENKKDLALKLEGNAQIFGLLSRNTEILKKVSKFQVAIDKLESNQNKLMDLHALFGKDISNADKVKNSRREELIEGMLQVIRVIQVYAHDKKKKNLQRQMYVLTVEYVQNILDDELIKISKEIWRVANKHAGYSLTFTSKIKSLLNPENSKATVKFEKEYGLSPEMIKNLEEAIIGFIKAMLLYQEELAEKENLAIKMKEINKQTKKLLANKIDRFVLLFEHDNPAFYEEYLRLRDKQLLKPKKEPVAEVADFHDLLLDDEQLMNKDKPKLKPKPKTPQKTNIVKK